MPDLETLFPKREHPRYSEEYETFADYMNAIARYLLRIIEIIKQFYDVLGINPQIPGISDMLNLG